MPTLDLGHCSFTRPKAQVHASAQATASFSADPSCPILDLSSVASHPGVQYWFARSPSLQINISFIFDHNLGLIVGRKSPIEQVLTRSFEQAQLWAQLGLKAYLGSLQWSSTRHASNLTFILSAFSCHTIFESLTDDHDPSSVQPPVAVTVHRMHAVNISIDISRAQAEDVRVSPSRSIGPRQQSLYDSSGLPQALDEGADLDHTSHAYERSRSQLDCVAKRPLRSARVESKVIFSLADACFRQFLCVRPRLLRGLHQAEGNQHMSLASIAPAVFMPGHIQELSSRAHLIQPIARFLAAFKFKKSTKTSPREEALLVDDSKDSASHDARHETLCTKEVIAGDLWMSMSQTLALRRPGKQLKPLELSPTPADLMYDLLSPQDEMFGDSADEDVQHYLPPSEIDSEEISLFDIYSSRYTDSQDWDRIERPEPSSCNPYDTLVEYEEEDMANEDRFTDFPVRIRSSGKYKWPRGCEDAPEVSRALNGHLGILGKTNTPLRDTLHASPGECNEHELDDRKEQHEIWESTSAVSMSSIIMLDDDNGSPEMSHADYALEEMLDTACVPRGLPSALFADYDRATNTMLDACELTRGGELENTIVDQRAKSFLDCSSAQEVAEDDLNTWAVEGEDVNIHNLSHGETSIGHNIFQGMFCERDTVIPEGTRDHDQDMIDDSDRACVETGEDSNSIMSLEDGPTYI